MTPQRHKLARQRLEGASYEEIAAANHITYWTVVWHFRKINGVLGISRPDLFPVAYMRYCQEHNIRLQVPGVILSALESKR